MKFRPLAIETPHVPSLALDHPTLFSIVVQPLPVRNTSTTYDR